MGIAEQSATSAAAGLAREGKLPVVGSYATFSTSRNLDQIRVSVCYSNLNVLIVGAHAGVSVGPDGATHQALEDLFAMMGLPNMSVVVPCDIVEARKATTWLLLQHHGPKYIRFAREATPVVSTDSTPFIFGKANRIRLRHEHAAFLQAFDTRLDEECSDEGEDLTIIACGPEVPEAMRAAWILRQEYGYVTRILNMHTLKPIDRDAIIRAARETGAIVTAEEHQIGALSARVSSVLTESPQLFGHSVITSAIGIKDRFGDSGAPWELVKELEVSAEHIAVKAAELMMHKSEPVGAASRSAKK
jgi:transketolase